jgi:hypothetical protein
MLHDLGRVDVLVGPVHFGDVDQAFDAIFDFDEAAVVGDVGDLAEQARGRRVAAVDVVPGIIAQLLQTQRDAHALAIEAQDADFQLITDFDHFGRMTDALPGHVGDVQQAVDAAQVQERTVVGEVLDHTLDHCTLGQALDQVVALGTRTRARPRRDATPPGCCGGGPA